MPSLDGCRQLAAPWRLGIFLLLILLGVLVWGGGLSLIFRVNPFGPLPQTFEILYGTGFYLYLLAILIWFSLRIEGGMPGLRFNTRGLILGILGGVAMVAGVLFLETSFGIALYFPQGPSWVYLSALFVALGFGIGEELLFRGLVFNMFLRDGHPHLAIWISAALWSLSHFIRPNIQLISILPAMGGLLLAGLLLGLLRLKSASLWWPIGIHSGWVYVLTATGQLSMFRFLPEGALWHGYGNPMMGLLGIIVLASLVVLLWRRPCAS